MSKGSPFGGVSFAAGAGGGATVVAPPVLPWICDWTGTLLASLVVGAAELASTWLAAATDVAAAALDAADVVAAALDAADVVAATLDAADVAALVAGLEAAS
jgi:hypothetical protein